MTQTTPLADTIPFTGFKSNEIMATGNSDWMFIRTAPDFINLIILGGFKANYLSIFEISNNQLIFKHNIRQPWYYRSGTHLGTGSIAYSSRDIHNNHLKYLNIGIARITGVVSNFHLMNFSAQSVDFSFF